MGIIIGLILAIYLFGLITGVIFISGDVYPSFTLKTFRERLFFVFVFPPIMYILLSVFFINIIIVILMLPLWLFFGDKIYEEYGASFSAFFLNIFSIIVNKVGSGKNED